MSKAIVNYVQKDKIEEAKDILESAGNIIKNGGTVIFPTETVYGLGANALDPRAARRIYKAKGRPSDNPLIVHICDYDMLDTVAKDISDESKKLIEKYWPGPLTMIFYKKDIVPDETTSGLETVAVRMPSNEIALRLIKEAGLPIAAPSANMSGKPSITSGKYAIEEMADRVDMIIIEEDSEIGIESTVVDMTTRVPMVLRPGKIGQKEILKTLAGSEEEYKRLLEEYEELRFSKYSNEAEPRSPGMKYTHYSPNARLVLLPPDQVLDHLATMEYKAGKKELITKEWKKIEDIEKYNGMDLGKVRVLTTEANKDKYGPYSVSLGEGGEEIGKNLFRVLRDMDEEGIELIFCEDFEQADKSEFLKAVMNRIKKAASNVEL